MTNGWLFTFSKWHYYRRDGNTLCSMYQRRILGNGVERKKPVTQPRRGDPVCVQCQNMLKTIGQLAQSADNCAGCAPSGVEGDHDDGCLAPEVYVALDKCLYCGQAMKDHRYILPDTATLHCNFVFTPTGAQKVLAERQKE